MRAVAYVACSLLIFAVGFGAGFIVNVRQVMADHLSDKGLTKDSAKLYHRCIALLNRMTRITELDGAFSEDILSDGTKDHIASILDAHREGINK